MVRVGGGWTTLSHFLARHGADPDHQITADQLLPLDAKPSASARKRSSSTHTLVISTGHPLPSPDPLSCATPTTAITTAFHRFINSTPASRRSSVSSPDPSLASSSGYSSPGGPSIPHTRIPVLRRRRLPPLAAGKDTSAALAYRLALPRSSSLLSADLNGNPVSPLPRSTTATEFGLGRNRYPNYLQSSQHITNRAPNLTPLSTHLSATLRKTAQRTF